MDPRKGFRIESDGTTMGTKLYDENGNAVGGVVYIGFHACSDEDKPYLRVDFLSNEPAEFGAEEADEEGDDDEGGYIVS